jgi:hypothetical protein
MASLQRRGGSVKKRLSETLGPAFTIRDVLKDAARPNYDWRSELTPMSVLTAIIVVGLCLWLVVHGYGAGIRFVGVPVR